MVEMDPEAIKEKLDEELQNIPWVYKIWNRENSLELRNKGTNLCDEELERRAEEFIEDIGEDDTVTLFEGKSCIGTFEKGFWIDDLDRDGEPKGKRDIIEEDELKELVEKSIERVDSMLVPTNRVHLSLDKISDIYNEDTRDRHFVTITIKGNKSVTLRDEGGLQFRG